MPDNVEQQLKNEKYKAERAYDFAPPGSGKETMAKIKFKQATKMLEQRKKAKDVPLGSGLAETAKKKLLSRREQLDKAMKDAGA